MNATDQKAQFNSTTSEGQRKVRFELGMHRNSPVIFIRFPYSKTLTERVRKLPGAKWSATQKAWYVSDNDPYRKRFGLPTHEQGKTALIRIHPNNRTALQALIDTLRLKGYSENTQNTYRNEFTQLLLLLGAVPVNRLNPERLRSYMLYCTVKLKLSEATLHSRLNAIKFYVENVLKQEKFFVDIPRPKKHLKLPQHIGPEDVKRLLDSTTNLKHNTLLRLCYGMGLRVSELVALKLRHIDSGNMQVQIVKAKGKKDRYVNLPKSILTQLRKYYKEYKPKEYLFEGQFGGPYTTRSAQVVFKNAMKKAGINKEVGIHGLRHSYATHLLEAGTDISHIQKLLGHENIKTTLIYAKVSDRALKKVISPLDTL